MEPRQALWGLNICLALWLGAFLWSCEPAPEEQAAQTQSLAVSESAALNFEKDVYPLITRSCMPCHHSATLPEVIARVKALEPGRFKEEDGDTRLRLLGELEELQMHLDEGLPLSFTDREQVHKSFERLPGEFYLMLEKGLMPPPWGDDLLAAIEWPNYQPLSWEERVLLLKYAKPYSQQWLH